MAEKSIAEAFPAETRYLSEQANWQINAICLHVAEMANGPDPIHDDDLRQTLLHAIAVRASNLSEAISALACTNRYEDPRSPFADACRLIEGSWPGRLSIPPAARRSYGLADDSPLGAELLAEEA